MQQLLNLIYIPLAWILKLLYLLVGNYGWAIVLFAVFAKVILLPTAVKSEKNRLKMQRIQPKLNEIQKKFANDRQRASEEMQKLYEKENYSPTAGCLPLLIQFPLILGLYNAIRRPLTYVNGIGEATLLKIVAALGLSEKYSSTALINQNELVIADEIAKNVDSLADVLPKGFEALDLSFLGLNLGHTPVFDLSSFSDMIIPVVSLLTAFALSLLPMFLKSHKTEQKQPGSMYVMMILMPFISFYFGFKLPLGVSVYWIASNVVSLLQTVLLPMFVKADPVVEKKHKNKLPKSPATVETTATVEDETK